MAKRFNFWGAQLKLCQYHNTFISQYFSAHSFFFTCDFWLNWHVREFLLLNYVWSSFNSQQFNTLITTTIYINTWLPKRGVGYSYRGYGYRYRFEDMVYVQTTYLHYYSHIYVLEVCHVVFHTQKVSYSSSKIVVFTTLSVVKIKFRFE